MTSPREDPPMDFGAPLWPRWVTIAIVGVVALLAGVTVTLRLVRMGPPTVGPSTAGRGVGQSPRHTPMVELVPAGPHGEPAYVRDQRTGLCFITFGKFGNDFYSPAYSWVPCDGQPLELGAVGPDHYRKD